MAEQKQENINNTIRTSVGKVIDIFLSAMPGSTGYDWYLAKLEGGLVLVDVKKEYVSPEPIRPIRETYRFLAVEPGSYKLAFNSLRLSSPSNEPKREVIEVIISAKQENPAGDLASDLGRERFAPLSSFMEIQDPIVPYGFPNGLGDGIITLYGVPRPLYGIGNPVPVYGVPVYGIPDYDPNGTPMPKYGVIRPLYGVDFPPGDIRPLYGIPPVLPYGVPPFGVPPIVPYYGVSVPPNNGGGLVIALYGIPNNSNGNLSGSGIYSL